MKYSRTATYLTFSILCGVNSGCVSTQAELRFPEPLRERKTDAAIARSDSDLGQSQEASEKRKSDATQRFHQTPPSPDAENITLDLAAGESQKFKADAPLTVSVDSMPLPAFINEVFGNQLGLSFEIATELQAVTNLVTLRLDKPERPASVYEIARDVLARYGVEIVRNGSVYRFQMGRGKVTGAAPLLVSGSTLPSVPVSHRDVFLIYTLKAVSVDDAARWLGDLFDAQSLEVKRDTQRGSIWLKGRPGAVEQASQALRMLDAPAMRGRHSIRVEPLFVDADKLAKSISDVMNAQGYSVAVVGAGIPSGAVWLLPIKEINSLLVFANDAGVMDSVKAWAQELDRPGQRTAGEGLFRYVVKNTSAAELAQVLDRVLSDNGGAASQSSQSKGEDSRAGSSAASATRAGTAGNAATATISSESRSLVVDTTRNALIFKGSAERWQQVLPIVREMDVPPKQVLIEVLVAEVQLSDDFKFGVEWAINNAALGESLFVIDKPTNGSTPTPKNIGDGIRIGAAGLSYYPISNSGQTRAVLNLFAQDSNVVIHQTPRIMVKSGEQASITVGSEVPILTSQSNVPGQTQNGTSALVQQIQYRSTGVSLNVTPTVFSSGRVDLIVDQQLSESTTTSSLTPTILNRAVSTALSLNDGGSVLIGGLITNNSSGGETKVPILGDIPLVGELFKSRSKSNSRTELMVLIVPYVIDDPQEAERLTKAYQEKLELMVEGGTKTSDN